MASPKKKTSSKKASAKNSEESKAAKFKRLGEQRTTKAINGIRGIGRLANKSNYDYTPEQAEKICEALQAEVVTLHELFTATKAPTEGGFTL